MKSTYIEVFWIRIFSRKKHFFCLVYFFNVTKTCCTPDKIYLRFMAQLLRISKHINWYNKKTRLFLFLCLFLINFLFLENQQNMLCLNCFFTLHSSKNHYVEKWPRYNFYTKEKLWNHDIFFYTLLTIWRISNALKRNLFSIRSRMTIEEEGENIRC
jgi:hypothetical protein